MRDILDNAVFLQKGGLISPKQFMLDRKRPLEKSLEITCLTQPRGNDHVRAFFNGDAPFNERKFIPVGTYHPVFPSSLYSESVNTGQPWSHTYRARGY